MSKARVLVISLGGTMAMTGPAGKSVAPSLDAADLIRAVPALADFADIEARSFRRVPGAHLSVEDVLLLAREIASATEDGYTGVVVTQGTDTLEETAFALDLLLETDVPVVVTGAMRNPSLPGADGPANLLDAVTVAAADHSRGVGCTVVLSGEIHAARFVRKAHTVNLNAFTSITGPLGWVIEGRPQILMRPASRPHVPMPGLDGARAFVALLTVAVGDDGRLLSAMRELGCDGLVVEALGAGHVPPAMVEALGELAKLIPVVLCSRTGSGPVLAQTYGFPGSEKDLLGRGLLSGSYLDGPKARIALTLALRAGAGEKGVRRLFRDSFGAPASPAA